MLASGSDDNTIKLWNVESRTEVATLKGHSNWVKSVAFNSEGTLLASGSYDRTIKLRNVESRTEVPLWKDIKIVLIPLHLIVRELCWHPDLVIIQ